MLVSPRLFFIIFFSLHGRLSSVEIHRAKNEGNQPKRVFWSSQVN